MAPITAGVGYVFWWALNRVNFNCTTNELFRGRTFTRCDSAVDFWILWVPLVPLLVFGYLYTRGKYSKPWGRAAIISFLTAVGMGLEAIVFAPIILATAGIGYLIGMPLVATLILYLYGRSK